jgi:beta propeller repeat protein
MKPDLRGLSAGLRAALAPWPSRLLFAAGLAAMVLFAAGPGTAAPRARVDDAVREELDRSGVARVIVRMTDASLRQAESAGRAARGAAVRRLAKRVREAVPDLEVRHQYATLPLLAGKVSAAGVEKLAALPEVEGIYPDRPMHALLNQSGPLVGQPEAEAAGFTGKGMGIAIIDTGIDYLHPALGGNDTADFSDVKPGHWAWRFIQAAAEHGIVAGYSDGSYKPGLVVTRDQMAVFIARALAGGDEGVTVPTGVVEPSFSDVPESYWAYRYIEYCKDKGIVAGFPDGSYGPTEPVDRGQMAVFVARAAAGGDDNVPDGPDTATFSDVTKDGGWAWAYKYIEYASSEQIVQGYPVPPGSPAGTLPLYKPQLEVTRDQMPVFVARAFHLGWSGRVIAGANLMTGAADPTDPADDNGHGTTVAGIAASSDLTYRGVAPEANLIALKVLDANGIGVSSDVIRGIDWCIDNQQALNIRAINLSVGDGYAWSSHEAADAQPEGVAITAAVEAGIVVAVAAGNEAQTVGLEGISLPAAASDAVSVGATKDGGPEGSAQPADGITYYTDRGELLTMYAPGSDITGPTNGGGMEFSGQGTSFSAPHVAGAAAVLASMGLTDPREIRARLARTGVQIVDPATGVGTPRLDLVRALNPPTNGPDLVVTAVTTPTPDILAGETIAVGVTVKNQGNATAAATTLIVVASANSVASPQDPVVVSAPVPSLAPGQSYSPSGLEGPVRVVAAGDYWLGAYVDDGYQVAETDETNNGLAGTVLHVGLPSARVESASVPATAHVGQSYPVTIRMHNDGEETWTPGEFALVPARAEDVGLWGISQVALASPVAPGGEYTFTFTVTAPSTTGAMPCYWQMAKGGERFGEVATGATKSLALDAPTVTQAYPTVSNSWVVFEDYSGECPVLKAVPRAGGTAVTLPTDIHPTNGWPYPAFEFFRDVYTSHIFPALSGNWLAWMCDDMPLNPDDYSDYWAFQVVALDLSAPAGTLPLRVNYQTGDGWLPDVDGTRVVWEDYRNDSDRMLDANPANFLSDNPDIYLADLTQIVDATNRRPKEYPICTAPGPQFAPRISGNLIVWEDWRDLTQGDIYCYDLSVDSDGDGIPNWKDSDRPNPDPAERRLTNTPWTEEYPDVSGHTVVWMDFRRDIGASPMADIYGLDLDTSEELAIATDPQAFRQQPRISGTQVVWEDWQTGLGSVYWCDLATGVTTPLAGGFVDAGVPDISGSGVTYVEYRDTDTQSGADIYSVWLQTLHPYVQVVP